MQSVYDRQLVVSFAWRCAYIFAVFLMWLHPVFSQNNRSYARYSFQRPEMGALFSILIYSNDSSVAGKAALQAFDLIDSLNVIFSDYLEESELNRLCRQSGNGRWIPVSSPLFLILKKAVEASKMSQGCFDITVGPISHLWRNARREGRLPDRDSLKLALSRTGYRSLQLDEKEQKVKLLKAGMQLDLGGIAKGATGQYVVDFLKKQGLPYCMIDAGGDIVAGGLPPGVPCWHVAVNYPESDSLLPNRLCISNQAVTTSGDYYQHLFAGGRKYSHIIDPRNGKALTHDRNITVISQQGIDADWLTKACSILPLQKAMKLIASIPGAALQIGVIRHGRPVFYRSKNFEKAYEGK